MISIWLIFHTFFFSPYDRIVSFHFSNAYFVFSHNNLLFTFIFYYREALPRLDNYRLSLRTFKRPSISLLHGEVLEHIPVSRIMPYFIVFKTFAHCIH